MLNYKIIFLLILIQFIQNQYIKFIFKLEEITSDSYIEKRFKNNIKTELQIGSPIQKIPFYIRQNQTISYISGNKIINHIYDELKSNTYKNISEEKTYYNNYFSKAIFSSEKFIFNSKDKEIETNNLTFILATNQSKNNKIECAVFGLQLEKYKYNFETDFIYQLKSNNIIKNFAYTFKFNNKNENEGELIIGEYPHEYDKNYKKSEFLTSRFSHDTFIEYWSIDLDKTFINNELFENKKIDGIFQIEFGVFIGNENYKNKINETFFNSLIQDNSCSYIKNESEKYCYYVCNSNINIKKFPNLKFYNIEMKYYFELNYNDLFIKEDDKYYFIIAFFNYEINYWILGRPFLKKFQIIFDQEKKLIGFYQKEINFSILILILLGIVIIILILYIMKFALKKNKRIKANELLDDIDYSNDE